MRWDSEDEHTHIVESIEQGDFDMTPFEQGKIDGQWTAEQVRACGFASAQECLEHQEQVYRDELAKLPGLGTYAAKHAEYMEGYITAERETLRQLMK